MHFFDYIPRFLKDQPVGEINIKRTFTYGVKPATITFWHGKHKLRFQIKHLR